MKQHTKSKNEESACLGCAPLHEPSDSPSDIAHFPSTSFFHFYSYETIFQTPPFTHLLSTPSFKYLRPTLSCKCLLSDIFFYIPSFQYILSTLSFVYLLPNILIEIPSSRIFSRIPSVKHLPWTPSLVQHLSRSCQQQSAVRKHGITGQTPPKSYLDCTPPLAQFPCLPAVWPWGTL